MRRMWQELPAHAGPENKSMGRSGHHDAIPWEDYSYYLSSGVGGSDSSKLRSPFSRSRRSSGGAAWWAQPQRTVPTASALFKYARTRFENLAPKYLCQEILIKFFLVLIRTHNHLLYPENRYCCRYPVCQQPSNLTQTGPKHRWQHTCSKASSYHQFPAEIRSLAFPLSALSVALFLCLSHILSFVPTLLLFYSIFLALWTSW